MLNHSANNNCSWAVKGDLRQGDAVVELRAQRRLVPGTELSIRYAEEGNEAMLFRYGFVAENNPADAVMLRCPLGPRSEWDETMQGKVKMLRVRDLFPW